MSKKGKNKIVLGSIASVLLLAIFGFAVVSCTAECTTDKDCPSGFYCSNKQICDLNCRSNNECSTGQTCGSNGKCEGTTTPAKETANEKTDTTEKIVTDASVEKNPNEQQTVCKDGESKVCYEGKEGTLGQGVCQTGRTHCIAGSWGSCEGQIVAGKEVCNYKDDDCNGLVDDGITGCASQEKTYPTQNIGITKGTVMPNVYMTDCDNKTHTALDVYKSTTAKVLYVSIHTGWCPACKTQSETLRAVKDQYGDKIVIWNVLYEGIKPGEGFVSTEYCKQHQKQYNFNFPQMVDQASRMFSRFFDSNSIPFSMLVTVSDMKIQYSAHGFNKAQIDTEIAKLMKLP